MTTHDAMISYKSKVSITISNAKGPKQLVHFSGRAHIVCASPFSKQCTEIVHLITTLVLREAPHQTIRNYKNSYSETVLRSKYCKLSTVLEKRRE